MLRERLAEYYRGITSEDYARKVIQAYMDGRQSLKWLGSMLEFWSSGSDLRKDPARRKSEIVRVIDSYGGGRTREILSEMRKRGLV